VFQGAGGLPLWLKGQAVAARRFAASDVPDVNIAAGGAGFAGLTGGDGGGGGSGGAQEATVLRGDRRPWQ
jgi:hypothetical protein